MTALSIEVCDAVTSFVKAAYPSLDIVRQTYGAVRIEDTAELRAFVYPGTYAPSIEKTRGDFGAACTVVIDIVNFADTQQDIDDSIELAEDIERLLINETMLEKYSMVDFTAALAGRPPFEIENMNTENAYHAVLEITYMVANA